MLGYFSKHRIQASKSVRNIKISFLYLYLFVGVFFSPCKLIEMDI